MKRSGHGAGFSTWGFLVEKNALAAGHLMVITPFYKNLLSYKLQRTSTLAGAFDLDQEQEI